MDRKRGKHVEKEIYMSRRRYRIRHIVVILFGVYLIFTFTAQQLKLNELARQRISLEQQTEIILKQQRETEKEIQKMDTDEYIEDIARSELGLVKPGDVIYKLVEPDISAPQQ